MIQWGHINEASLPCHIGGTGVPPQKLLYRRRRRVYLACQISRCLDKFIFVPCFIYRSRRVGFGVCWESFCKRLPAFWLSMVRLFRRSQWDPVSRNVCLFVSVHVYVISYCFCV